MDQQTGGVGPGRGPGETASELKARQLDGRLEELKKAFQRLKRASETQRKQRAACKRIVLVGYTNAGKTSLMNALASTELSARDVPFETLDITSRCLTRHGTPVLLSDTVGFIRRLPERLMASFESTLSEIKEASLLVIVTDISDPERTMHLLTTEAMLEKLGAADVPRLYAFNKADRLDTCPNDQVLSALSRGRERFLLSSNDATAVSALKEKLLAAVRGSQRSLFVPYAAEQLIAAVYKKCRVIDAEPTAKGMRFLLEAEPHIFEQLEREVRRGRRQDEKRSR
jgi:GTP-binding protein HflX